MNILRIFAFVVVDFILLTIAYISGMYKSLFFQSITSTITTLPTHTYMRSLLLIIVMSLPILLVMFLINQKFIHLFKKVVIYSHFGLVVSLWVILTILLESISAP